MGTVHICLAVLHLCKLTIYNIIVLIISQNMLAIGIMLFINYMTSIVSCTVLLIQLQHKHINKIVQHKTFPLCTVATSREDFMPSCI